MLIQFGRMKMKLKKFTVHIFMYIQQQPVSFFLAYLVMFSHFTGLHYT